MSGLGTRYIDDVLTFYANTTRFDTGVATDADAVPSYRVYEEETGTAILTGNMALLDSSNTAGFYSEQITLSAANGFEVGKSYAIYIAATVNSVAGAANHQLVIRKKPLSPTVEGRELDVTATGAAGIDWGNVENPTTTNNLSGTSVLLAAAAVQAIWDALTSALTTVGSIGKLLVDRIDAAISSRLAAGSYTAPDNAGIAAIKAQTDSLTFTVPGQADVNIKSVNDVEVIGTGAAGDEWGPV